MNIFLFTCRPSFAVDVHTLSSALKVSAALNDQAAVSFAAIPGAVVEHIWSPWLFGGLDMHEPQHGDYILLLLVGAHQTHAYSSLTSGIQTAGLSSKGGAIYNFYRLLKV
ncbi:hypothetical protein Ancab_021127 [Ancistrocladus abbreviatus]